MELLFLMFLQHIIMFKLTSGQKNFRTFTQTIFFELNFLFNCVKPFSKTVRKPVTFLVFIRYLCVSNVYLMLDF